MKNLIMYRPGKDSWISWIKKRIKNNLNFVALLTGPTGIGKSWNAIQIAYLLDPEFDSVEQIAFNFIDLMRIINKFNNGGANDPANLHKKKFKICIFDEAQTSVSKRTWQAKANKFLLFLLSTFRHQRIIVLFTTPYEDYLDSNSLKLFHAKFECNGWSKKTKKSRVRPKILQYNPKKKKFYEHSLHVIRGKKTYKLVHWDLNMPLPHLTQPYEQAKFAFTNALNKKIYDEMMAEERKGEIVEEMKLTKELTNKQAQGVEAYEKYGTMQKAADNLGISLSTVHKRVAGAQKKGYKVKMREEEK